MRLPIALFFETKWTWLLCSEILRQVCQLQNLLLKRYASEKHLLCFLCSIVWRKKAAISMLKPMSSPAFCDTSSVPLFCNESLSSFCTKIQIVLGLICINEKYRIYHKVLKRYRMSAQMQMENAQWAYHVRPSLCLHVRSSSVVRSWRLNLDRCYPTDPEIPQRWFHPKVLFLACKYDWLCPSSAHWFDSLWCTSDPECAPSFTEAIVIKRIIPKNFSFWGSLYFRKGLLYETSTSNNVQQS